MKQFYKVGVRIWILLVSVVSFLLGWAFFAHSNKPVAAAQAAQPLPPGGTLPPIPTLPPVGTFNNQNQSSQQLQLIQPVQPLQQMPAFNFPSFRSGGS